MARGPSPAVPYAVPDSVTRRARPARRVGWRDPSRPDGGDTPSTNRQSTTDAREEGGDMDLGANADGELLQRALDGEHVSEPGILELVAVLHAVQAVDQAGLAPRAEFVSDLRARLLADDASAVVPPVPLVPLVPLDGETGVPTDPTSTPSADERATD